MATQNPAKVHPLIVIIGATGTGKSKLAVELARQFNGEIINGDAMQMYHGLPIITNKISHSERDGIPHHLLDCIPLQETPWTVNEFVSQSTKIIDRITSMGKLPIVVGGTHYYTHALLFKDAILANDSQHEGGQDQGTEVEKSEEKWPILNASTEEILSKLQEIDPVMAARWHPNDRRKIQRSLEIWLRTGRKASEIYTEQKHTKQDDTDLADESNKLLRYDPLFLWPEAEDHILKQRLDARVDTMVADGLLDEVLALSELEHNMMTDGHQLDRSKGIWVSIGYKELEPWVAARKQNGLDSKQMDSSLAACLDSVKASTRRYAKRQTRYIRIRLANDLKDAGILNRLFLIDTSELATWSTSVTEPTQSVVQSFLGHQELPNPSDLSPLAQKVLKTVISENNESNPRSGRHCATCNKTLMTEKEWQGHLASRGHKKTLASQRKRVAKCPSESSQNQQESPKPA